MRISFARRASSITAIAALVAAPAVAQQYLWTNPGLANQQLVQAQFNVDIASCQQLAISSFPDIPPDQDCTNPLERFRRSSSIRGTVNGIPFQGEVRGRGGLCIIPTMLEQQQYKNALPARRGELVLSCMAVRGWTATPQ